MSEIGLNINVDSYNNEGIKTIKGNNNAEIYKLYILKNKRRLNLVGKTVKLGYVMAGTTKGDIIENLNITNAEQGEITFPITNRISKQDGVYSCQLAIYGADEFLEYTATFGLTVEANIFTKIAGEIENSKDLTYIERILEEAKTVSGDLKTNIPVATNLNSSLESNISNARNINTTLADTTEKSKVAATDAIEKKSQLESSITKAKEFIDGLDGSQNIPGIRMELTELQNGLKSNQALAYQGSSITANDTLEGRTEGMRIKGKTLLNIHSKSNYVFATSLPKNNYVLNQGENYCEVTIKKYPSSSYYYINAGTINFDLLKPNQKYTLLATKATDGLYPSVMTGGYEFPLTSGGTSFKNGVATMTTNNLVNGSKGQILYISLKGGATYKQEIRDVMIFEGDLSIIPDNYFEGIKSFGEAEQVGDKYKISILSHGKNLFDGRIEVGAWKDVGSLENAKYDVPTLVRNTNPIKIKPNTQYIMNVGFAIRVNFYDKQGNLILQKSPLIENRKFISPPNSYYFCFNTSSQTSLTDVLNFKYQLEYGKVSTEYQKYISNKKDILLKEPLKEGDYVYEDNGQVKVYRDARKYVITGNEDWSQYTDNKNFACMGFFFQLNKDFDAKLGGKFICNNFKGSDTDVFPGNITVDDEIIFVKGRSGEASPSYIKISILKSKLTTQNVEGFKEWLKANPTEIVYQLATPVTEVVENCIDIDLDTYQEKTYFNILNSLPGTLDFKVPSNIGSLVQNMAKEVNNIWDVINNLLVPSIVKANGNLAMLKLNNNLN